MADPAPAEAPGTSWPKRLAHGMALRARLDALEASVAALRTHTHRLGTFGGGTQAPAEVIP